MDNGVFKIHAKYWVFWAEQSIKLVRDFLSYNEGIVDEPRLRSYYILLSYSFELALKSKLIAITSITEEQLKKKYGHNIEEILKDLKSLNRLPEIGISRFKKIKNVIYEIETANGQIFYIYNFTDIRYNPKQHKEEWDTEEKILETTKIMLGITKKIINKK